MNAKEELTKLLMESYDRGVKDAKQEALAALEKVVAVMVAYEREACAKVCDSFYESWINIHGRYEFMGEGAQECAAAIRARGEQT
jgi:hypothetical protein